MMNPVPADCVTCGRPWRGGAGCPKKRSNRSPPKKSVISCARGRDSVRMFTTDGLTEAATVRNVDASIAPLSGALLVGGTCSGWADEAGARSSREAMTMPTASEATAISKA
jgi:hypothetical protein